MANLLLIIIVATVALVLVLVKANTGLVFLALCAGNVLVDFTNRNTAYVNGHLNSHLLPRYLTSSQPALEIAILLAPAVIVIILAKHSSGPSNRLLQIFPAIATGLVGSLLVVPLLSINLQDSVLQNRFWGLLEQNQVPVVALGVLVSVLMVVYTSHSRRLPSKHSH